MSLREVRVGDVMTLERAPITIDLAATYVPVGIRSFGRGIFRYEPTDGAGLGKLRFFELRPGRLVVSNIKGWEGAIAVSTGADAGCIASNRFLSYVVDPEVADVTYLKYFFLSESGLPLIQRASPGSADRNRTLAMDRFEALKISLPEIGEQRRVATKLDAIADRSAIISARVAAAAELSDALRSSIAARPDFDETTKRQRGWNLVHFGDIASLWDFGELVDPTKSYRIAGVYSFGRGLLDRGLIDGSSTSYKNLGRLRAGNVVMSRLKAWEGAIALVPQEFDGAYVSPEFPQFEVDRSLALPEFLGFAVSSPLFWESLARGSKGIGARRERVSAERLLAHEIWLPPLEDQRQAASQLERLEQAAKLRRHSSARAAALAASALNQAFAGVL